jgi:hypothetical protein
LSDLEKSGHFGLYYDFELFFRYWLNHLQAAVAGWQKSRASFCMRADNQPAPMRMRFRPLLTLLAAASALFGQTAVDLRRQARNVDFSQATSTKPFRVGTGLPNSCAQGEGYLRLDAAAGRNIYICASNNSWAPQGAALDGEYSFGLIAGTAAIGQGGTGASTASGALANLGAAPTGHTHVLTDLTGIAGKHGNAQSLQVFGGGALNTGDCASFDATGNLVSAGLPCNAAPLNYGQTFTAATSVTLQHNLRTTDLFAQCFDGANRALEYGSLTATSSDTAAITFAAAQSGRCILSGGAPGGGASGGLASVVTGVGLTGDGSAGNPVQLDPAAVGARLSAAATLDFGSIGASSCAELPVPLAGARVGDEVMVGAPADVESGFVWSAYVGLNNTVTVRLCKVTAGTTDPAVRVWRATIVRSL